MTHSPGKAEQTLKFLRLARTVALECAPYYGRAILRFRIVPVYGLDRLVVHDEQMRSFWDIETVLSLAVEVGKKETLRQLAFAWVHIALHFLREHVERGRERRADPEVWHVACDLEINDWIPEGLTLPAAFSVYVPRMWNLPDGKPAEFYYEHLPRHEDRRGKRRAGFDRSEQPKLDGFSLPDTARLPDGTPLKEALREADEGGLDADSEPDAGGEDNPVATDAADAGTLRSHTRTPRSSSLPDLRGVDEVARRLVRDAVATEILQRSKSCGTLPSGMLRWARETKHPKVRWQTLLRKRLRKIVSEGFGNRVDYSYRRPSRKSHSTFPVVRPSLAGGYSANVVCVIDTSGSISEEELAQAKAEVGRILLELGTSVTVIPCDAVAYEPIEVKTRRQWMEVSTLTGGGGTDMVRGVHAACQLKPAPDIIVVLTDGFTPFPRQRPNEPAVVWVIWCRDEADMEQRKDGIVQKPWKSSDFVFVPLSPYATPGSRLHQW